MARDPVLGLRAWRATIRATLAEIEAELDRHMARVRTQIMTDLALASTAADLQRGTPAVCPECGGRLCDEGQRARTLVTLSDEPVTLERDYATCAACGRGLFLSGSQRDRHTQDYMWNWSLHLAPRRHHPCA